ncbi:hypothetical protein [Tenacibaculum larymnensis]|uniref:Uncharacterized protein n=1 Tax=Tenacibaculum larymnensis TaxID=2878201 RepID=A0A9X4EM92_9FLAO|nr:hypothetical protein [Tenacibaculum larymnensis]MDE1206586.1 hypothetical protein [Tenacibaculum larymnensis]
MSSTIGIIPTKNTEVTFGEIITLSEKYINSSLNTIQLKEKIKLQIHILNYDKVENKESYHEVDLTDIFEWKKNQLLIFSIKGVSGVIKTDYDVIFDPETSPNDPWWKLNTYKNETKTILNLEDKFEKAKKTNKSWFLHRSDEKDKVINICGAIISASIAELTSALISSTDQTWEFGQYFVEKEEFLNFYLHPEKNITSPLKPEKVINNSSFWDKLKKLWS